MTESTSSLSELERQLGDRYDVAILGGGLAGSTLALQIKRARPSTRVVVAEKRPKAAPEAAFKVGESTVEIGAFYFRDIVGAADHLEQEQLRKHGLRFFLPAGDNSDIAQRVEFCGPTIPGLYTHQIDRGRFENELAGRCGDSGVEYIHGAFVDKIELGKRRAPHAVTIVQGGPEGERRRLEADWLVDASGPACLLKRQLGLEKQTDHTINSAWFRLAGGFDLEDWSADPEWLNRVPERGVRMLSTNHLTGEGYWVWLIQLASGPISIGVCADPRFHPLAEINELDRLVSWFAKHEPQLAAVIEARRDQVLDFLVAENYSYGCERVYSPDRWCITGVAGVFLDPLYSPGSDFIALSNSFITDLVVRDLTGEKIVSSSAWRRWRAQAFLWISEKAASRVSTKVSKPPFDVVKATRTVARDSRLEFFNFFYFRLFSGLLAAYQDQYRLFGNPQVMVAKHMFGAFGYWSSLATIFMHGKITDTDFVASLIPEFERFGRLAGRMELFFREWHDLDKRQWTGVSVLSRDFTQLLERQQDLIRPFDDDALRARIVENIDLLYAVAIVIFHKAAEALPEKPGADEPINALAISLQPDRWRKDGLLSDSGVTLAAAREMVPGIEEFFLEERGAVVPAG